MTTYEPELKMEQRVGSFSTKVDGIESLRFTRIDHLAAEVDNRGPRKWLVRGVWPSGDYGVLAAEPKAGKTWMALDLAVSVATGLPWLGSIAVDDPGPVLVFAGEGGEGNIVRRLRAIGQARGAIWPEDFPNWVCTRAPHLSDTEHLHSLTSAVKEIEPRLVIIDPLYLATGGAKGSDLYAMGQLLEAPQRICQAAGASLLVVTHYNRSRDLKGSARITGAGPAEWGRVLLSCGVISRRTDPETKATTVLIELDVTGGEVPDQRLKVLRTIRAEDPDDLDSHLFYEVKVDELAGDEGDAEQARPGRDRLAPAERKILEALRAFDIPRSRAQVVDKVVELHGHGLRRETVSRALNKLQKVGLADSLDTDNLWDEKAWFATAPDGGVTA